MTSNSWLTGKLNIDFFQHLAFSILLKVSKRGDFYLFSVCERGYALLICYR